MGLASNLMRGVTGHPKFVSLYKGIAISMEQEQEVWIASLRAAGVKAAHPDDGWVNREKNTVSLVYPQFDDGATHGDLIALGRPQWGDKKPRHRIVRLHSYYKARFMGVGTWEFEPTNGSCM